MNLSLKLSSLTAQFDADPCRGDHRSREPAAAADPPRGSRAGGLYPRRHGAIRLPGICLMSCFAACSRSPSFATGPMSGSSCKPITPMPRTSCACSGTGSSAGARRSRSGWSRGPTGTTRSRPPGGWAGPSRSTLQKWQSDASFERCTRFLIEHHDRLRPAFGSHNVRSLAHAIAAAEARGLPPVGLRAPNPLRHGRRRSSAPWSIAATACGSIPLMAPSCPAWPTWCGGCWKTRRTSRS